MIARRHKTFGAVPVGALFQLPDDPDNAMLEKVSRTQYVVVTRGHPARGLRFRMAAGDRVKRGRQAPTKARSPAKARGDRRRRQGPHAEPWAGIAHIERRFYAVQPSLASAALGRPAPGAIARGEAVLTWLVSMKPAPTASSRRWVARHVAELRRLLARAETHTETSRHRRRRGRR